MNRLFPKQRSNSALDPTTRPPTRFRFTLLAMAAAVVFACGHALAVTSAVDQFPLGVPNQPKPNVMFILDDSSSMTWEFMPDDVDQNGDRIPDASWGQYSPQCNGLAYDPSVTYSPPVKADGSIYPSASYPNAMHDGFTSTSVTDDISARFYTVYSGSQPAMSWSYTSWGSINASTTFYKECTTPLSTTTGIPFTRVAVSSLSATQQANYANWYAYYRTRSAMLRTGAGRAIQQLGENLRVGFTTIHYGDSSSPNKSLFLDVADFTGTSSSGQRGRFFDMLYNQVTIPAYNSYTPLRTILSSVGRYYGKKLSGQSYDPVQYSCQKNYALIATDGYWNMDTNVVKLDGATPIGDEDGKSSGETAPYLDSLGAVASLADVAEYYYKTDLRSDAGMDGVQNMGLFTLGLGLNGTLSASDWSALQAGTKAWPIPNGTTGASTWGDATHIDDLWHAAINGRGQYFNATSSTSLFNAINSTFSMIAAAQGSGAASASSNQTPVTGDDWLLVPSYTSVRWTGDLKAFHYTVSGSTLTAPDTTKASAADWSAAAKLAAMAATDRKIYFNGKGSLQLFNATNLTSAGLSGLFNVDCGGTAPKLSQCSNASLTTSVMATATTANLIAYLGGARDNEKASATDFTKVFRERSGLLGDLVNAAPVFLGKPPFAYVDAGYAAFASANANRTKVAYVASNDGMLHAFKVDTAANGGGTELWAFVPTAVMPEMYRLADATYGSNHHYFLDATPVVADVYGATKADATMKWRSILIVGQGAGGRSYFALDVTTPSTPVLLWEFGQTTAFSGSYSGFTAEDNQGLTYASPVVTKRPDGTWVVAIPSGLNNTSPGDGKGHLFVLNALTGEKLNDITTSPGDSTRSNDIMRIEGWVDSETNNTTRRFYGGDLQGNLWRFDPFGLTPPDGAEAVLIGQATDAGGTPQPITTRPLLSEISTTGGKVALVSFGTGRFLASNPDFTDSSVQSIYTVKDKLAATGVGKLRAVDQGNLVQLKLDSNRATIGSTTIDWTTRNGWFVDLDVDSSATSPGERIVIDGLPLSNGVIAFGSTLPTSAVCTAGGKSYLYQFSLRNGTVVNLTAFPNGLISGLNSQVDESGNNVTAVATLASGKVELVSSPADKTTPSPSARRTSWRELVD